MTISEKDVAAPVVTWLGFHGWEVHQEVDVGRRADIVGRLVRPDGAVLLWIIEVKTRCGLALMDQLDRWDGYGNYVSGAAPNARAGPFLTRALRDRGFGLISVSTSLDKAMPRNVIEARLRRRRSSRLEGFLCEETRTWAKAGGTVQDEWFTPYRKTCRAVAEIVRDKPGIVTKELMDRVEHHYASDKTARSALLKWAQLGKVPGIEVRVEAGRATWWPAQ